MSVDSVGPGAFGGAGSELIRANPQAQQWMAMISALYHARAPLYDPSDALMHDPNAWSKIMRDDRFRAYVAQRLAKVARINFVIEPGGDTANDVNAAATVEQFIRSIPGLTSSRRHLAKFAFWGRACAWIEGHRRWKLAGVSEAFPHGMLAEWWEPTALRPLDSRQVVYQPEVEDRGTEKAVVRVKTLLGTIDARKHVEMQHPECLITAVYDDEVERLGYGRGLLETLYHVYWVKCEVRRIGLSGLEKWAHGIVAARVDANARAGTDETTQATAQAFLDSLQAMRSDGAIVLDKNDEVEVLTTGAMGQDATHRWLQYCDEGAAQLCLSAVRPMGGKEGGAYNQGEIENASTEDLLDCDRELLDEQITRSVIGLWWDLNASNMVALGLGDAKMPRFRSRGLKDEDPEKVVRVLQGAQALGMEISVEDAHRRTGVKRPALHEQKLEKPSSDFGLGGGVDAEFSGDADGEVSSFGAKGKGTAHEPDGKFGRRLAALSAMLRRVLGRAA